MKLDILSVIRGSAPHPVSVIAACGEKPTFGLRRLVFAVVLLLLAVPVAWAQVPPTVVNPTNTSVTIVSAVLGGEVTSDGGAPILDRGVVFAATATNADPVFGAVGATRVKADAATGVFTVQVAGLPPATDYSFKAYAINSAGTAWSAVGTFSTPAAGTGGTRSSLTGAAVSDVTSDSATISATAGSASGRFRGAVYSEVAVDAAPPTVGTGVTQWVDAVTGNGFFQTTATGLKRNTQYAARVFSSLATGNGALSILPAGVFTTLGAPIVTAPTSADVTGTGATLGGTVASDGGFTERGVVYALTSVNSNPEIGGDGVVQVPVAGTDIGAFTTPVSGLTTGASYSFKAYATNADGTGYSTVGTFTAAAPGILVTTAADTVADDGLTSLREAVTLANSLGGANTIGFSDGTGGTVNFHDATPETITLIAGQLDITSDVTIEGPGAEKLTVSGNNASRIFRNETASLTVSGLTLTRGNGNGDSGGAIFSRRPLSLRDCRLVENAAPTFRNGGAITQFGGTLELIRCVFSGNVGPSTGGAIFAAGITVQIVDCWFSGNRTTSAGGALSLSSGSSGVISGTTFDDNESGDQGGGLNAQDCFLLVSNCTFSGNRSATRGGAVYALGFTAGGTVDLVNCTVAGNTATSAGAIYSDHAGRAPTVTLRNTILSGNSLPELGKDATATITSLGYNLCSDAADGDGTTGPGGLLNATGDRRNTAALLAPLADNGGPTQTHAPQPGSPALEAGDPAFDPNAFTPPLTTDQRGAGFPRVVAGRVDIGAVEGAQLFSVDLDGSRTNGQTTPAADFGSVTVGGSGSLTLIVAVPGGGSAVTLQGITLPTGYRINTSGSVSGGSSSSSASVTFPATIQPGGSLFIDVIFEPVAPGLHAGNLVIANDAVPNFSFAITGTGVAAEPYTVDLDGARTDGQTDPVADFGVVPVNGSELRTLIVANPAGGQPNLQITGFTVPAGFRIPTTGVPQQSGGSLSQETSLPRSVPPGTSVFIDVFFEPTAPGTYGGMLGIQTNAAGDLTEFTFEVAGETPAPVITVSLDEAPIESNPEAAPVCDFGNVPVGLTSAPVEFVIGNEGAAPLNITDIRVTLFSGDPTPDFSLTSEALPITIEPEGEVVDTSVFSVVFHPTAVDSFFAIVTIETDDPNEPTFTFPIAGTGIAGGGGQPTQDDYFFANRLRVELDVLDNDEGTGLGLDVVTQPVPAGSASIFANRVRFTPAAPLTGPVTFNYSASSLLGGGTATPRQVIVRPYADAAGTYVGLLLRADGSVRGRIVMTANGLGTLTAKLRYEGRTHSCISNVNATVLNIPGVAPAPRPVRLTRLTPDSLNQPVFGLRMPDSVPGEFLTCVAERSPYRPGNPTPQAGRYTMVAETTGTGVPNPAAMMTCTVSSDGTVKFGGRLGNGVTITQAGKLLNGGRLPFYVSTGANAVLERISGVQLFDRTASPAVTGTLNWQVPAGADARIPGGLAQDYELFGLPYTAAASGVTMFAPSSPTATLTLTPTLSATLSLAGSPTSSGFQKISGVGTALGTGHLSVQPATGFFNGVRVIPGTRTTQRFHGVVLQGGGVNEGRGTLTAAQILTITLKP